MPPAGPKATKPAYTPEEDEELVDPYAAPTNYVPGSTYVPPAEDQTYTPQTMYVGTTAPATSDPYATPASPPPDTYQPGSTYSPEPIPAQTREPSYMPGPPTNYVPGSTHVPGTWDVDDMGHNYVTYPTNTPPVDPARVPGSRAYDNRLVSPGLGGVPAPPPPPVAPWEVPGSAEYAWRDFPRLSAGLGSGGEGPYQPKPSEIYGGSSVTIDPDTFTLYMPFNHPARIETLYPQSGRSEVRYTGYIGDDAEIIPTANPRPVDQPRLATEPANPYEHQPRGDLMDELEYQRRWRFTKGKRRRQRVKGLFGGGEVEIRGNRA